MLMRLACQIPVVVALVASLFGISDTGSFAPERHDREPVTLIDVNPALSHTDTVQFDGDDTPDDDFLLSTADSPLGLTSDSHHIDDSSTLGDRARDLPQNRGPPTHFHA